MGFQMSLLTQKQVDGEWINIRVIPRDPGDEDSLTDTICSTADIYQRHWDWLGMYSEFWYQKPKGLPVDMQGKDYNGEFSAEDGDFAINWFMLDELLAVIWDVPMVFHDDQLFWHNRYGNLTIRQFLGQPFIDWLQHFKDLGVERIVYYFS